MKIIKIVKKGLKMASQNMHERVSYVQTLCFKIYEYFFLTMKDTFLII